MPPKETESGFFGVQKNEQLLFSLERQTMTFGAKRERNRVSMLINILIVVLGLIALAAGVFSWKLENGSFGEEEDNDGILETVIDQGKDEENE